MSVHRSIKFCGLTRPRDVDEAVTLGVDLIGLVFAERSQRRLDSMTACRLRERIPSGIRVVALFMDNPPEQVKHVIASVRPDVLQFHGSEDEAFCARFALPYFKAIAMGGLDGEGLNSKMACWPSAEALLFDGHAAGEQGGSGRAFDWQRLAGQHTPRFLLAGGLNATNVAHAIKVARPWGVDVSSGIESAPGIKDPRRMRAFVKAARLAETCA
jgi:phosphoribosylanthranilate isomerase